MARFQDSSYYHHGMPEALGVLVTNLGTPNAPTARDVRRYLGEFLWDPRVVEIPRPLWWLILNGIILRTRPRRSAESYAKIWRPEGSPLLVYTKHIADGIHAQLVQHCAGPLMVEVGMRYGEPSLRDALQRMRDANVRRLLVLPLYPQYSATTTASTFDAITQTLQGWRWLPELRFVNHYHDDEGYVHAIARSIHSYWAAEGPPDRLLMSFHGLPKRNLLLGDPYHCECHKSARLIAEQLELEDERWAVSFQSRFGRAEWLQPYTAEILREWAKGDVKRVDVVCPGFPADCLETLEEIGMQYRDAFLEAGGESFRYIPALNDQPQHIQALTDLTLKHIQGWPEADGSWSRDTVERECEQSRLRALAMGAER